MRNFMIANERIYKVVEDEMLAEYGIVRLETILKMFDSNNEEKTFYVNGRVFNISVETINRVKVKGFWENLEKNAIIFVSNDELYIKKHNEDVKIITKLQGFKLQQVDKRKLVFVKEPVEKNDGVVIIIDMNNATVKKIKDVISVTKVYAPFKSGLKIHSVDGYTYLYLAGEKIGVSAKYKESFGLDKFQINQEVGKEFDQIYELSREGIKPLKQFGEFRQVKYHLNLPFSCKLAVNTDGKTGWLFINNVSMLTSIPIDGTSVKYLAMFDGKHYVSITGGEEDYIAEFSLEAVKKIPHAKNITVNIGDTSIVLK